MDKKKDTRAMAEAIAAIDIKHGDEPKTGMTTEDLAKLDEFAKAALPGILTGKQVTDGKHGDMGAMVAKAGGALTPASIAKMAYDIAKAMLAESKKRAGK